MPKLSANLSMLFTEQPFPERFAAAARAGFRYVEYLFPYDYSPDELRDHLDENGLQQVLFNLPAGDWPAGDRGIATDGARVEEFRAGLERAIEYAKTLGVPRINCLAGIPPDGTPRQEAARVMAGNLAFAAARLAEHNLTLLVEPINTHDIPGFFVSTTAQALELFDAVGADNLKLQYDVYHAQRMEGELAGTIRSNLARIGHIQIADNPQRNQPGTGEINYKFLLHELDRMGYEGWVGAEYKPDPDTLSSLGWIQEYGLTL